MPRYALKIEYDGRPFVGWQRQPDLPGVQAAVERAIAKLDPVGPEITGAGRTDAGVHATEQVAHVDLSRDWDPYRLGQAINAHLRPHPVAVVAVGPVSDDFHARFSAMERRYLFRLVSRGSPLVHDRGFAWRVRHELDAEAMRQGAAFLIGKHDFTAFRSSLCQAKSPVKTLDEIRIVESDYAGGVEFRFYLRARSFLHNQVRSIVGTLERVGSGAWEPERVGAALASRDRAQCGPVSPPDGLYLTGVDYPKNPFAASNGAWPGESGD